MSDIRVDGDQNVQFLLGTLPDGRVLVDFRGTPIDHLKLTPDQALELAEYLVHTAKEARRGRHILVAGGVHDNG